MANGINYNFGFHGRNNDVSSLSGADVLLLDSRNFDFTGVTSYATGGVSCDLTVGFPKALLAAFFEDKNGYGFQYDATNKKIKVYSTGGTEVTNATDIHTIGVVQIFLVGM